MWAKIPVVCEVFNVFAHLIPQAGLSRIEKGRKRQGLVPDYKLPGEAGENEVLCELKCMSASESRYPRNPRPEDGSKAVNRRADGLTAAYLTSARGVDQDYCGTPRPPPHRKGEPRPVRQVGPVESHLLTYGKVKGWVFGAWGEVSEEIHVLVQRIAKARLEVQDTLPGRRGPATTREARLAALVSWVRRQLSFLAVQQQSRLLLDRLQQLGDWAKEARSRSDCNFKCLWLCSIYCGPLSHSRKNNENNFYLRHTLK